MASVDVQVLKDGEPRAGKFVEISLAETKTGVSLGIYSDEGRTDDDGHATFDTPDYDDYDGKYIWIKIGGERYGPWDLVEDAGYTVDIAVDD